MIKQRNESGWIVDLSIFKIVLTRLGEGFLLETTMR